MSISLRIPRYIMVPFYKSESIFRKIYDKDMDKIALGGGTVLAMHWQHRISTDLDYFLDPRHLSGEENIALIKKAAEHLKESSPSNTIHSLETAPYHLKFKIDDTEVSLFTSRPLISAPASHHEKHTSLKLENISEILAKKISGRIMNLGTFTKRDFYDFCVACNKTPDLFKRAVNLLETDQLKEIADELKDWRNSPLIKQAEKSKPLLEPVYQELADNLWRYSEDVIRCNTVPDHLFPDIESINELS